MAVLERGGNAFDAAVAAGLALQVVEPHLNGPGGDLPLIALGRRAARDLRAGAGAGGGDDRGVRGPRPDPGHRAAGGVRAGRVRRLDAAAARLRDVGARRRGGVRDRLSRATGSRVLPGIARALDVGRVGAHVAAARGRGCATRVLADTYERIVRSRRATRARRGSTPRGTPGTAAGWPRRWSPGLLSADDLAGFSATVEAPVSFDFRGWTVFKTGPWGQGPVFLQQLALLEGFELGEFLGRRARPHGDRVREARVRGPRGVVRRLGAGAAGAAALARRTPRERRALVGAEASGELRPGGPNPRLPSIGTRRGGCPGSASRRAATPAISTSPTGSGTSCSATPSGGWLQSSPALLELGFCLGTRAQMFWLEAGLPASLVPGRRPRTTLSPSLAVHEDGTVLSFGTPGGDQQDQWSLEFFLAHAVFGLDLQAAIDAPMFHTTPLPELVLSARGGAAAGGDRGARAGGDDRGAAGARARRRRHRRLVARAALARSPALRTACCAPPRTRAGCRATPIGR